jgi:hypothetical protein
MNSNLKIQSEKKRQKAGENPKVYINGRKRVSPEWVNKLTAGNKAGCHKYYRF